MDGNKPIPQLINELRAMAVPELVEQYQQAYGKSPRIKHRDWLWRRIAWRLQEQRLGGLSSVAKRRLDELIVGMDLPLGDVETRRVQLPKSNEPVPGTILTRTWKGVELRTTRVESGWEFEGVIYKSLSAVAKAATGSHRSGRAFFGLSKRKACK